MKEIRVKISKDGTLTLPKEVKDEFKGASARLFRSKSDRFTIVKTVPKVAKPSLAAREAISGKEISREDLGKLLRIIRPNDFKGSSKKVGESSFDEMLRVMREVGKEVTPKDLEEAIREVRTEEAKRKKW